MTKQLARNLFVSKRQSSLACSILSTLTEAEINAIPLSAWVKIRAAWDATVRAYIAASADADAGRARPAQAARAEEVQS